MGLIFPAADAGNCRFFAGWLVTLFRRAVHLGGCSPLGAGAIAAAAHPDALVDQVGVGSVGSLHRDEVAEAHYGCAGVLWAAGAARPSMRQLLLVECGAGDQRRGVERPDTAKDARYSSEALIAWGLIGSPLAPTPEVGKPAAVCMPEGPRCWNRKP